MNATSILQSTRDLIPLRHRTPPASRITQVTARGLALFSVALGAVELIAPKRLAAMLGLGRRTSRATARNITVALGAVAGIALLDICVAGFISSRLRR
jgi:hypothetical protein